MVLSPSSAVIWDCRLLVVRLGVFASAVLCRAVRVALLGAGVNSSSASLSMFILSSSSDDSMTALRRAGAARLDGRDGDKADIAIMIREEFKIWREMGVVLEIDYFPAARSTRRCLRQVLA